MKKRCSVINANGEIFYAMYNH